MGRYPHTPLFTWGGIPIPLFLHGKESPYPSFYMGRNPHTPLLRGYAPRSCGYFYETIKVAKSVFKRKAPLENLLWGERHRFAVSTSPTVP